MRFFLFLVVFYSVLQGRAEAASKIVMGETVSLIGVVDRFHFFHHGNNRHLSALVLRVDGSSQVLVSKKSKPSDDTTITTDTFQIAPRDRNSEIKDEDFEKLRDGVYVDLEGAVFSPGETSWYTNYPLLHLTRIKRIFEKDPNGGNE